MTGIDFTKTANPVQTPFLNWPTDITESTRKQIAIESNIPQTLEIIIVNGENNQNERAQSPVDPGFLAET